MTRSFCLVGSLASAPGRDRGGGQHLILQMFCPECGIVQCLPLPPFPGLWCEAPTTGWKCWVGLPCCVLPSGLPGIREPPRGRSLGPLMCPVYLSPAWLVARMPLGDSLKGVEVGVGDGVSSSDGEKVGAASHSGGMGSQSLLTLGFRFIVSGA